MTLADAPREGLDRLLAFTWVGHLPLALDGQRIVEIDAPSEHSEGATDVFALFGVVCTFAMSERRVARLSNKGQRWILLGDRVELGTVRSASLLAPPTLLAGLSDQLGLLGFVSRSGTLFSLFDPTHLALAGKSRREMIP